MDIIIIFLRGEHFIIALFELLFYWTVLDFKPTKSIYVPTSTLTPTKFSDNSAKFSAS